MVNKAEKSIFVSLLIALVLSILQFCVMFFNKEIFVYMPGDMKITYILSLIIMALTFIGYNLLHGDKFKKLVCIPFILAISHYTTLKFNLKLNYIGVYSPEDKASIVFYIILLICVIVCVIASIYQKQLSRLAIVMLSMVLSYTLYNKIIDFFTMIHTDIISGKLFYIFINLWEIPFLIAGIITLFINIEGKSNSSNTIKSRLADEIIELQDLVQKGLMSQEEYETKRKELISRY